MFRFALSKVVLCVLTCLLCVCFLAVGWPWQLCFFQLLLPVVFLLSSQVMIAHMDLGRASGSAITIWNEYVLAQLRRCVNRKGCKSAHRNWKATAAPMTTYMCGHRTSQLLLPGMRCFACDMILWYRPGFLRSVAVAVVANFADQTKVFEDFNYWHQSLLTMTIKD